MLEQIGFFVVATALLVAAFRVVTSQNLVHTVLWLGISLALTAVVFLMLHAPFLAAIQIILYTGGVLTLMLFGVMLTNRDQGLIAVPNPQHRIGAGVLLAAAVFGMLVLAVLRTPNLPSSEPVVITTQALGVAFFTEHLLAFEVLSLLLLAAVLGAIVLARRGDPAKEGETDGPRVPARRKLGGRTEVEG